MASIIIILVVSAAMVSSEGLPPLEKEAFTILPELTENFGYSTTEFTVNTKDGYIIKIHRMRGKSPVVEDLPVFLMHGIISSSEDYVRMGPNRSLAYLLVDQGYEVWLGNLRGNQYTSHKKMDKTDVNFWRFCFDEHGRYDLPAMLNKVLEVTNAPKMHFIGYSMGTTSYFIMCHHRPDLAAKIETFIALAPVVSLNPRVKVLARTFIALNLLKVFEGLGLSALIYNVPLQRSFVSFLCHNKPATNDLCYAISFMLIGEDYEQIEWEKARVIFSKFQPATLKQLAHYGQLALSDNFTAFDWGPRGNNRHYGREYPPLYNLSTNIAPTALFHGKNDLFASPPNAIKLERDLKTTNPTVIRRQLSYGKFNHFDFIYSKDIKKLINDEIINMIPTLRKRGKIQNQI